jgi:outer membrane receptor protein involved in Fe transport
VSVTILKRDALQGDAGGIGDIFRRAPGLNLVSNNANLQRLSIRGVGGAGEATTGLYYDETPVTGPAGLAADAGSSQPSLNLFDAERVEVLRGPQGTLYGAGSIGGTIRVVFNKPDLSSLGGRAELRASSTQDGQPGGSVRLVGNFPLVADHLAARVIVYEDRSGGYMDNVRFDRQDVNDGRTAGFRAAVAFAPTPDLTVLGTVAHQRERIDDAVGYWFADLGRHRTDSNVVHDYRSAVDLLSATAKWELDGATLTATASRYIWKTLYVVDYTSTLRRALADPAPCASFFQAPAGCSGDQSTAFAAFAEPSLPGASYQPSTLRAVSQELRLSSNRGSWLGWTAGYFFELRDDSFDSIVYRAQPGSGEVLRDAPVTGHRLGSTEVRQRAVYGELNLRPVDRLTVSLGARGYRYHKRVDGAVAIPNRITGSYPTNLGEVRARHDDWLTKLGVVFEVSPRAVVYANRSEGFRPGGANHVPGAGETVPGAYAPDRVTSYETGLKLRWFDEDRFTLNAAAYRVDWDGMQAGLASATGAFRFNANAGAARLQGGEIEVVARPGPGTSLSGGLAYTDGRLTRVVQGDLEAPVGLVGDRLPFTPRWTAAASVIHQIVVRPGYQVTGRVDYTFTGQSRSTFRPAAASTRRQPAYSLVDAELALARGRAEVSLSVANLLNAAAPNMVTADPLGVRTRTFSVRPRTISLTWRQSF